MYKLNGKEYIVQTVDFITPVVDDPYTFGRVAAINSLSDIYAMGAHPVTALSILMYNPQIGNKIISEILQGGSDELAKAKCSLIGGHTVDDEEIKSGYSVTGIVKNGKLYKNCTLREGDLLVYTKPLGIGILTTAIKAEIATESEIKMVVDVMLTSNYAASNVMKGFDISACTDITGFGLLGHMFEMASASEVTMDFSMDKIDILPSALKYIKMGIIPGGAYGNKKYLEPFIGHRDIRKDEDMILFDPQTSGGLLMGVCPAEVERLIERLIDSGYPCSRIIGKVLKKGKHEIVIS